MSWADWSVISIGLSWLVRLAMIPIVVTRKEHPTTCLAWLMVVFFEPWLGLILYWLFGEDRLIRKRLKRRVQAYAIYEPSGLERDADARTESSQGFQSQLLASLAESVGAVPVSRGNSMSLLMETEAVINGIIQDIDEAKHHVHLLFYIYAMDPIGQRVTEAVIRAKERGVECRVLLDDVGSWPAIRPLTRQFAEHGIEFGVSLPVGLLRRGLARIDLRNHRKLVVIDGCIAWTGSQNVVEDTYGHKGAGRWRDIMARITGPAVREFQYLFCEDWHADTGNEISGAMYFPANARTGQVALQLIPSGPDRDPEPLQHLVVEAIHSARRIITITSPYFIPDDPLLCALTLAVRRGVVVRLIVPRRSDQRIVDFAGAFYLGYLLKHGVEVFRFDDGLLHAKTLTVDDCFGMFGSANYDIRSFQLNFEMNVSLYDEHSLRELHWVQEEYLHSSPQVTWDEWQRRPAWKRLTANVAKLFSPLL